MVSRYYFHLTDGHDVIPDEIGIEVSDDRAAMIHAFAAIEELRMEADVSPDEWEGWRLDIMDASGRLMQTLALDKPPVDLCSRN